MADKDLYSVLEVPRTADAEAIKKAYRALAMKYHPDRNQGNKSAEERFKAINHANDVLGDPKKRALYDEFGEQGLREGFNPEQFRQYQRWGGGAPRGTSESYPGGNVDVSDLFEQMFAGGGGAPGFGGRRRARAPVRGADLEGEITIELPDAVRGIELPLTVNGNSLKVRVPAGVHDGARLRITGKGQAVTGGRPGDLMLTVHVRPHPSFWVEEDTLHVTVPVTFVEAWRGAKVRVPTPGGDLTVRVPPKTPSATKLRLRGKGGAQGKSGEAGDLIVHVEIALPPDTPEVEAIMQELEKLEPVDPRADLRF